MNKFLTGLVGLVLVILPSLSQAKIGDKKADFEAANGKPIMLAEVDFPWSIPAYKSIVANWLMYKSDFYPADPENPLVKYIGVWYGLGKIVGVYYPFAGKDETVIRALQESLGTSDLTEDFAHIPLRALAYRTEDYKYKALVIEGWGTFVGTRQFIDEIIAPIFRDLYKAWQAAEAAKATSPNPTPTPD